ncbi:hypothetical protein GQ457_01G027010 [Hibiscus cannabinus]
MTYAKEVDVMFSLNKAQSINEETFWSPPLVDVLKRVVIRNHEESRTVASTIFNSHIVDSRKQKRVNKQ